MFYDLLEYPRSWAISTLKDIATVVTGSTPPKKNPEFFGGNIPFFKPTDLNAGYSVIEAQEYLSVAGANKSRILPSNTVLVTCIGATIGKIGLARGICATNQQINAAIVDEKYISPYWLYWVLNSPIGQRLIIDNASATTLPILNKTRFGEIPLPLPPLNEQRRIVAKIDQLTTHSRRARQALDDLPTLIDQFRQSVLAAAFRGDLTADWRKQNPDVEPAEQLLERIRADRRQRWEAAELEKMRAKGKEPKDDKWKEKYKEPDCVDCSSFTSIPRNWCWVSWEQIGISQNGRSFPSKDYAQEGVRLLRPGNLHVSGKVKWTDANSRYMANEWAIKHPEHIIQGNEIVINLTAQSLADEFLGRVCLTDNEEYCLLNQRIARLVPSIIKPSFCLWLFKSPLFRRYVDTLNTGSMIQHIFTSQIDKFVFPLPPLAEQDAILAVIESKIASMDLVNKMAAQANLHLPSINQSILAKAFRGELVPQDPNDEPASILLERIRAQRQNQPKPSQKRRKPKKS